MSRSRATTNRVKKVKGKSPAKQRCSRCQKAGHNKRTCES